MISKALKLCYEAHKEQKDKGGAPYYLHPIRVALCMETPSQKVVALLHDIVEDTEISLDYLRDCGFTETIIEAVEAITRRSGEPYNEYLCRVKKNELAREVKIEDLLDNLDLSRLPSITAKDKAREKKYKAALRFLCEEA